jgi:hypothetical protein
MTCRDRNRLDTLMASVVLLLAIFFVAVNVLAVE